MTFSFESTTKLDLVYLRSYTNFINLKIIDIVTENYWEGI